MVPCLSSVGRLAGPGLPGQWNIAEVGRIQQACPRRLQLPVFMNPLHLHGSQDLAPHLWPNSGNISLETEPLFHSFLYPIPDILVWRLQENLATELTSASEDGVKVHLDLSLTWAYRYFTHFVRLSQTRHVLDNFGCVLVKPNMLAHDLHGTHETLY